MGRQTPTQKYNQEIPGEQVGFSLRTKSIFHTVACKALCNLTPCLTYLSAFLLLVHSTSAALPSLLILKTPSPFLPRTFAQAVPTAWKAHPLDTTLTSFGSQFNSHLSGNTRPIPSLSLSIPFPCCTGVGLPTVGGNKGASQEVRVLTLTSLMIAKKQMQF